MAQPVWVTESGNLGTIAEDQFYRILLEAYDPDFPTDSGRIKYRVIAGKLPNGMYVGGQGMLEGIPKAIGYATGVPYQVNENITSDFTVRVYTEKIEDNALIPEYVNDRTFSLTITGQDIPQFQTASGLLGRYFDGQLVDIPIETTDDDPADDIVMSLASGELPSGVSVSSSGLYGYIEPVASFGTSAMAGWDNDAVGWIEFPWDYSTRSISKHYQFTLKITDGVDTNLRTYSIFVVSRDSMTTDTTEFTADSDYVTCDVIALRQPYITNYVSDLGTVRHDNHYAYQCDGIDPDGDPIEFVLIGSLPTGLQLDASTGWIYGNLADINTVDQDYSFSIKIRKLNDIDIHQTYDYTIKIIGDTDAEVKWDVPDNLGLINNGEISTLYVTAKHINDISLQYKLKEGGVANKLPQGLTLLPSGNIIGRVSYEVFKLVDNKKTTDLDNISADSTLHNTNSIGTDEITIDGDQTTFDQEYAFSVNAYDANGLVSIFNTFTIAVNHEYDKPTNALYVDAFIPEDDRDYISSVLSNASIINPNLLYRIDDYNFGVADKIQYNHAYGLNPETLEKYVEVMQNNHFDKSITIGELKTAQALDDNGDILYEVVYAQMVDNLVNNNGTSISSSVDLSFPYNDIQTVTPNSLLNMQEQMINNVGQVSTVLPRWMLSKQIDGTVLGFTSAWVIAYTLPNKAKEVAYNINNNLPRALNTIDFRFDRFTLETYYTKNWDSKNFKWWDSSSTTFDSDESIHTGKIRLSTSYAFEDLLLEENTSLITLNFDHAGLDASSIIITADQELVDKVHMVSGNEPTIFDNNTCSFVSYNLHSDTTEQNTDSSVIAAGGIYPASTEYVYTDNYNKYLMMPHRRIIDNAK